MSLRGIWVVHSGGDERLPRVLFSRRWPTVERRSRNSTILSYYPIPPDGELGIAVVSQCSQTKKNSEKNKDTCSTTQSCPVYKLFGDQVWPVVCVQKDKLLFIAIPLNEQLTESSSTSVGYAIVALDAIITFFSESENYGEIDEQSTKFGELYQFLSVSLPFGSAQDICDPNSSHIIQAYKSGRNSVSPKVKKPVWQSGTYRGAPKLTLTISEEVGAVQYDKPTASDTWEVSGVVDCKADLEGYPDILLTLSVPREVPPLDHLVTHSCVQTSDSSPARQDSNDLRNRKLRFSPPIGVTFPLAQYKWSSLSYLPIRGFYQMKGDDKVVKLLIQLKLHESMRNNFEYCTVHIPIFNRGPIERVDNIVPVTSSASLALSQDRKIIKWTIGQRFPSKGLELSLQASVHFYEHSVPEHVSMTEDDPFCIGPNSYIDVLFKVTECTISNSDIDARSITLFPPMKYKLTINREVYCKQYRIWNSHGDALFTWPQMKLPS